MSGRPFRCRPAWRRHSSVRARRSAPSLHADCRPHLCSRRPRRRLRAWRRTANGAGAPEDCAPTASSPHRDSGARLSSRVHQRAPGTCDRSPAATIEAEPAPIADRRSPNRINPDLHRERLPHHAGERGRRSLNVVSGPERSGGAVVVTRRDVAKQAGVSPALVSYVLNNGACACRRTSRSSHWAAPRPRPSPSHCSPPCGMLIVGERHLAAVLSEYTGHRHSSSRRDPHRVGPDRPTGRHRPRPTPAHQ
jgi:hypothetical protein